MRRSSAATIPEQTLVYENREMSGQEARVNTKYLVECPNQIDNKFTSI